MSTTGGFSDEALAAIEVEKDLLTHERQEVVITEDYTETADHVLALKKQVFDAVCKPGLSNAQKEEAFLSLIK